MSSSLNFRMKKKHNTRSSHINRINKKFHNMSSSLEFLLIAVLNEKCNTSSS